MIQVYPFNKAPSDLQALASQGGDEDWIVIIPKELVPTVLLYGAPHWIDTTDSCHEPVRFDLPNGDVLFVGCH